MKKKKTHSIVGYKNISYICSEINKNKKNYANRFRFIRIKILDFY